MYIVVFMDIQNGGLDYNFFTDKQAWKNNCADLEKRRIPYVGSSASDHAFISHCTFEEK